MKTFKRETISKISKIFLGSFLCCLMFIICQRRKSKLLFNGTYYKYLIKNSTGLSYKTETRIFNQSIHDIYDFSPIEKPQLWKNGSYSALYNLSESEEKSFLEYKEKQYQQRSDHISKKCKIIQAGANHSSQKSTSCSISGGK